VPGGSACPRSRSRRRVSARRPARPAGPSRRATAVSGKYGSRSIAGEPAAALGPRRERLAESVARWRRRSGPRRAGPCGTGRPAEEEDASAPVLSTISATSRRGRPDRAGGRSRVRSSGSRPGGLLEIGRDDERRPPAGASPTPRRDQVVRERLAPRRSGRCRPCGRAPRCRRSAARRRARCQARVVADHVDDRVCARRALCRLARPLARPGPRCSRVSAAGRRSGRSRRRRPCTRSRAARGRRAARHRVQRRHDRHLVWCRGWRSRPRCRPRPAAPDERLRARQPASRRRSLSVIAGLPCVSPGWQWSPAVRGGGGTSRAGSGRRSRPA
jgi:hypothetical protein